MSIATNTYFSGAGLMDLGLQLGGLCVQQSFEIDPDCCNTLRSNFSHQIIQCDMREKLICAELPCDVMVATYPCDRYSAIGHIHGVCTGDELYLHFFRHLAIARPEVYALENVPGMRKFPVVMEAMTSLPDYYVNVFCPVKSHLWLPQKRDRLIIIGSRKPFAWREPRSARRVSLREILEAERPEIAIPQYVYDRLDGKYRDQPIISDPARGDIAPTCVAHYSKDLSTRLVKDRRFKRGVRPYTVREYARLQGLPDTFKLPEDSKAYRMIGNGVSVPVGIWLAKEIRRYFRSAPNPTIDRT
jgi:DNA (cytosine-5)-methyltransferase 1